MNYVILGDVLTCAVTVLVSTDLPLKNGMKTGGKGIRTPDFQLAKLALYQLSYAPEGTPNAFACSRLMSELPNFDCRFSIARKKRKMPDVDLSNRHPAFGFFPCA